MSVKVTERNGRIEPAVAQRLFSLAKPTLSNLGNRDHEAGLVVRRVSASPDSRVGVQHRVAGLEPIVAADAGEEGHDRIYQGTQQGPRPRDVRSCTTRRASG
jgi:hypothetical protein